MPIIDTTPTPVNVARARAITAQIKRSYQDMRRTAEQTYNFVWNNPDKLTPQQALDAFGTDAADLLKIGAAFNAMEQIYFPDPKLLVPPKDVTVTPNPDGTVTVK